MFWNKKVTLERYKADVNHVDGRLNEIFRNLDPRTKNLESKLDLILDHLKLKYVPETETKEPAKLVKKEDWGSFTGELSDYPIFKDLPVFTKPKKKSRPKKKPGFTGSEYKAVPGGFIITPPAKKRGRPKKK